MEQRLSLVTLGVRDLARSRPQSATIIPGAWKKTTSSSGATIPRHGAETFWGGYSGVFVDPDGHPWEVAHNPFWTVTEDGRTLLRG